MESRMQIEASIPAGQPAWLGGARHAVAAAGSRRRLTNRVAIALVALVATGSTAQAAIYTGTTWYAVTPGSRNWSSAENYAKSVGGRLAAIGSASEQSFIEASFAPAEYWLGGKTTPGGFYWLNGESSSYSNWNAGEPNGGSGSVIELRGSSSHGATQWTWNDLSGDADGHPSTPTKGIIEKQNETPFAVLDAPATATFGDVILFDASASFDKDTFLFGDEIVSYELTLQPVYSSGANSAPLSFTSSSPHFSLRTSEHIVPDSDPLTLIARVRVSDLFGYTDDTSSVVRLLPQVSLPEATSLLTWTLIGAASATQRRRRSIA